MTSDIIKRFCRWGVALVPWLLTACNRAPTFDILGSLFPAWLVCLTLGILLAVLARWILVRQRVRILWPVLVYPSLAALFTFMSWLLFFG
jgi:hypothetical protein